MRGNPSPVGNLALAGGDGEVWVESMPPHEVARTPILLYHCIAKRTTGSIGRLALGQDNGGEDEGVTFGGILPN